MSRLEHIKYLTKLADSLLMGNELPRFPDYQAFDLQFSGFVKPKERPRASKTGHFYTPKETREFEDKVRTASIAAMKQLGIKQYQCPVVVHLQIFDEIPLNMPDWQVRLAKAGLYFEHAGGDLDNKEKAVLDAINQVVYHDDRLVVQSYKVRRFDESAGFRLSVTPYGLTKLDIINLEKLLTYGRKHAKEEAANSVSR